jgi:pre-mRNA-splicing factor ISY1
MLGEHRIRELNDEINALMKKKHYWELRIRELGGADFKGKGRQILDIEGRELPGVPGYRYYGAAKDLPGVRELFAEKRNEPLLRKRNRVDLYKNITPDYYGFRDDDDGVLAAKEALREKELVAQAMQEFEDMKRRLKEDARRSGGVFGQAALTEILVAEDDDDDDGAFEAPLQAFVPTTVTVTVAGGVDVEQTKQRLLESFL